MTGLNRRVFLKGALASSVVAVAAGAGLLRPTRVLAAEWPKDAFAAKSVADVLKSLYGGGQASASADVKIKAPIQAENGAVVPISVSTTLPNVQAIGILVEKNATPLVANTELSGAGGYFSARMKMAESSNVQVVVKAGGKLYTAKQMVKVTVGGCGG
ncbi:MAG: thiosulfate oxidation carrier protein SoxY [Gammaproteobacteria bacterium]